MTSLLSVPLASQEQIGFCGLVEHTQFATLAYGLEEMEAVDIIAGPGNRWVTAAKALVVGRVGIDMLVAPSELVVAADETGLPETIAADLIGQAEHDVDAIPILVTTSEELEEKELFSPVKDN